MTPLYGHTSPETAYMVNDYPYGRKLRCRIRYWLERDEKRGFRFVSQTEDPRNPKWNAPKKSTYADFAGAMYLNDDGHVKWMGLSEYAEHPTVAEFLTAFPEADLSLLRPFVLAKAVMKRKFAKGEAFMTINGQRAERTPEDIARDTAEADAWEALAANLKAAPVSAG